MRLHEFETINEAVEQRIVEGGASGGARYNTEVGTLLALAGNSKAHGFDPETPEKFFDARKLADPKKVFREIKQFLVPHWDEKKFWGFYELTVNTNYPKMIEDMKAAKVKPPTKFGWAGGSNQSDDGPADVEFVNHAYSGISIKDAGGITLANLTPKSLGLDPVLGEDIFNTYAKEEFIKWKKAAIAGTMKMALSMPDQWYGPIKEKYSIMYSTEDKKFHLAVGNKSMAYTKAELNSADMMKNDKWHRVIGDHLQANKPQYAALTKALGLKISKIFEGIMEDFLSKENRITAILQFTNKPYYYMTPKKLYSIPKFDDLDEIAIKGIKLAPSDGTSMRFLTQIGHPDSNDNAVMDIYVRYANGLFAANPTVRVQSIKNPEYIYWEHL